MLFTSRVCTTCNTLQDLCNALKYSLLLYMHILGDDDDHLLVVI